jgi:hypothetical protein
LATAYVAVDLNLYPLLHAGSGIGPERIGRFGQYHGLHLALKRGPDLMGSRLSVEPEPVTRQTGRGIPDTE